MSDDERPVVTDDGNQRLTVIERVKQILSDNPADFPKLNISHLMGGEPEPATDTRVRTEIDRLMPRGWRAKVVGAYLFEIFTSHPVLLYEIYLLRREGFVHLMKETMRPDSLASGLSDRDLELSWEVFEYRIKQVADKANWRKRKDWRG